MDQNLYILAFKNELLIKVGLSKDAYLRSLSLGFDRFDFKRSLHRPGSGPSRNLIELFTEDMPPYVAFPGHRTPIESLSILLDPSPTSAWPKMGPYNRQPRVISATLATCAAFLAKEASARETGFRAYREFLSDLFPNAETHWLRIPQSTRRHVLTFNYDRLFEMAFVDRFNFTGYGLYDVRVLNSGVTLEGVNIEFTPEAFSFLKLHGSVGSWTVDFTGTGSPKHQICYFEDPVANQVITVDDNLFFSEGPDGHPDHLKKPPLLFFPYQRQHIVSTQSGFPFDSYARAVWNRATELISNASEIHVIGYSFSGIDRGPMLEMLDQVRHCQRLVIQGLDADRICHKLKVDKPQLRNLIESAPYPF